MNQVPLTHFGTPLERVERALAAIKRGEGVLVTDDADRENEGDIIFAAETLTVPQMNMLIRNCTGIVCLCLTPEKVKALDLPMMVTNNNSRFGTGFTVSVDAAKGVTTGVSAADRVAAVKAAIADNSRPEDLARPGHMFPLKAMPNGVLDRTGHTEATVDLVRLAGFKPCGVLCELMNPDGTMAHMPEVIAFAIKNNMQVCTIEDLVSYRKAMAKKAL